MSEFKERPILFSAPMVRAILGGSKTQTRRAVKIKPPLSLPNYYATGRVLSDLEIQPGAWMEFRHTSQDKVGFTGSPAAFLLKCPYGKVGDQLWVRETWNYNDWTELGIPFIGYKADGSALLREHPEEWSEVVENIWAGLSSPENFNVDSAARDRKFRPSIHMPRWASRIQLEITGVRVELLNDISEADAIAEGVKPVVIPKPFPNAGKLAYLGYGDHPRSYIDTARDSFKTLWESINGAGSWQANPWVWVIEFKRVEAVSA